MRFRKCYFIFIVLLICMLSSCETPKQNSSTHSSTGTSSSALPQPENKFEYQVVNDTIKITKYKNNPSSIIVFDVIIPEKIDGKAVKIIGDNAFYQHAAIDSITLPKSLETIEHSAFYRCYSLKEINIPKGVSKIDPGAFFRCSSLTKISVESGNAYYSDIDGVLFNKDKTEMLAYPEGKKTENYTVPDTVKSLVGASFGYHCRYLEKLTILSNVVAFPDYNIFIFPDDITLMVESKSAAEKYAKEYGLNFEIIK